MNKFITSLCIILIITAIFFSVQLSNSKKTIERHQGNERALYHSTLNRFSKDLIRTSETLSQYEGNFSDKEYSLFKRAIGAEIDKLNAMGSIFVTLSDVNVTNDFLYYEYIYPIQSTLQQISSGKITDEEQIKNISRTMEKNGIELVNAFYYEDPLIDVHSEDGMKRILSIIDTINSEIGVK